MTEFLNFIDGAFVRGDADSFANRFPTTGEVIGDVRAASRDQVDAAVGGRGRR